MDSPNLIFLIIDNFFLLIDCIYDALNERLRWILNANNDEPDSSSASITTNLEEGVKDAAIVFLALPTPPGEDGSADLSYILGVAKELGKIMTDYKVIVDKSTVPVGTADKVRANVSAVTSMEFDVVSNPEFLREGAAVEDFVKPERVVIGSTSERAIKLMEQLYEPFVRSGNPIIVMDERSSELTKYAANAFLATKISFMNEIANVCELVGANVDNVRRGIGTDSRIGKRFLFAGIGYGGSCFPKDVQALLKSGADNGYDFKHAENGGEYYIKKLGYWVDAYDIDNNVSRNESCSYVK